MSRFEFDNCWLEYEIGDCLELMKDIPDKSIDLVLTDPPYGIGWDSEKPSMSAGLRKDGTRRKDKTWSKRKPKNYISGDWDNARLGKKFFEEMKRVSLTMIIWGANYYVDMIEPSGAWLVWDKKVPDGMSLSRCELAYCDRGGHTELFEYLWAGYKKHKPEPRYHPTQKPVALFEWILNKYSNPGDTVLDPFLGSGTTLLACRKTGRNGIGFEINPEYESIIRKRIMADVPSVFSFGGEH